MFEKSKIILFSSFQGFSKMFKNVLILFYHKHKVLFGFQFIFNGEKKNPFVVISLCAFVGSSTDCRHCGVGGRNKEKGGEVLRTAGSELSAALTFIRPAGD